MLVAEFWIILAAAAIVSCLIGYVIGWRMCERARPWLLDHLSGCGYQAVDDQAAFLAEHAEEFNRLDPEKYCQPVSHMLPNVPHPSNSFGGSGGNRFF